MYKYMYTFLCIRLYVYVYMYMFICICACICICIWICICICTCRCRCTHRYIFTCNTCYSIKLSQQNSCVREAEGSRSRRGLARPGKGRPRPHESATLLLEYAGIHFYIHAYIQTYKDTQILYDDMGVYIYIYLFAYVKMYNHPSWIG